MQTSNPIKLINKQSSVSTNNNGIKLTSTNLKSLKHDVNVLKQISDLRVATQVCYFKHI